MFPRSISLATGQKDQDDKLKKSSKNSYTRSQVHMAGFDRKALMIINNEVYDLKKFAQHHPGGAFVLRNVANSDCTEQFYSIHTAKTIKMFERGLWRGYVVGHLKDDDKEARALNKLERKMRRASQLNQTGEGIVSDGGNNDSNSNFVLPGAVKLTVPTDSMTTSDETSDDSCGIKTMDSMIVHKSSECDAGNLLDVVDEDLGSDSEDLDSDDDSGMDRSKTLPLCQVELEALVVGALPDKPSENVAVPETSKPTIVSDLKESASTDTGSGASGSGSSDDNSSNQSDNQSDTESNSNNNDCAKESESDEATVAKAESQSVLRNRSTTVTRAKTVTLLEDNEDHFGDSETMGKDFNFKTAIKSTSTTKSALKQGQTITLEGSTSDKSDTTVKSYTTTKKIRDLSTPLVSLAPPISVHCVPEFGDPDRPAIPQIHPKERVLIPYLEKTLDPSNGNKESNQTVVFPEYLTKNQLEVLKSKPSIPLVSEEEKLLRDGGKLSLKEIRKAIPSRCFEKQLWRSVLWLVVDLMAVFSILGFMRVVVWEMVTVFAFLDPGMSNEAKNELNMKMFGEVDETSSASLSLTVSTASLTALSSFFASLFFNLNYQHLFLNLLPLTLLKYLILLPLLFFTTGLFMCGLIVVGHDCAHSVFCYSELGNMIGGLLSHGAVWYPWSAWKRGHIQHHLKHNHITDDYGSRYDCGPLADGCWCFNVTRYDANWASITMPFFGMPIYLYMPYEFGIDGCHLFPGWFKNDRIWFYATDKEIRNGIISSIVCVLWGIVYFGTFYCGYMSEGFGVCNGVDKIASKMGYLNGGTSSDSISFCSTSTTYSQLSDSSTTYLSHYAPLFSAFLLASRDFWLLFFPSLLCGNFCFFICGYYQHHNVASEHCCCYDDSTWNYTIAAFQTVDHQFGPIFDRIFHHVTDGHVAHHLFFQSIPHYHLPEATIAIRKHLDDNDLSSYYKYQIHDNWVRDFIKDFYDMGFRKTYITLREVMIDNSH